MCVHMMGIAVVGTAGSEDPDLRPFIDALEVDRQLLLDAGDPTTAEAVAVAIDDLGTRSTQPAKVSLFLESGLSEEQIEEIGSFLDDDSGVEHYEYVSAEQAYDEFVEQYQDQPEFYEDFPVDALPASFRIETSEDTDPDELTTRLQELDGVDETRSEGQLQQVLAPIQPLMELCGTQLPGIFPDIPDG